MTNMTPPSTKKRGRPRKYATPEEFWAAAERYFEMCDLAIDPTTNQPKPKQYTVSGLALALGFSSLKELYAYSEYEEFEDVAERARLKVVNAYETNLQSPKCVGSIFALKNMGWRDERHVEANVKGNSPAPATVMFDFGKMSTAAMGELFNAMKENETIQ